MIQISNETEFKHALQGLDSVQQRIVAAMFVEHVLPLSGDERLRHAIHIASDSKASEQHVADALRSARAATFDSHTRCGAECNWTEQAGYFVARATVAALTPQTQSKAASPAWQAAMSCRMAQTSVLIDHESDETETHSENEWQYEALASYLNT